MRDAPVLDAVGLSQKVTSPFRFAGFVLDLEACTLARESGETIPLTHGEFAVLRVFVARPGRVRSRDALLDAFANRRFEPFDRSVDVLIGKLRRKIEPNPKQPRLIVTVPGEGYRFDGLRFRRFESEKLDAESASKREALRPRLSIIVLPFANIGDDPEQEPFVDGVTENLTTDLSRIRGAVVIARNTAFTYKGKPVDVKAMSSRAAFSVGPTACGSACSSLTPKPAPIFGPNGSTNPSPTFSTCKTKSSRVWRAR